METPASVLATFWKHDKFRPLQEEIINSILDGKDTLALLPTGGGKSVCFQVPALLMEGICIVVSPLIALMKDQVEQLRNKGIDAVAVHSGMSRESIDIVLNNCIFGKIKFLYLSPERLQTEMFRERVKQMNVSMLAVDEAHCISQWGYDFRPPYLQIANLRAVKPDAPVMALTATATKVVQQDIIDKLQFNDAYQVFTKSFARDNLSFVVRKTENKEKKLLEILQKVSGAAIIYVRSRKATQEIAEWLVKKGVKSSFYHAGLSFEERTTRQDEWIKNKTRVMVATNAFGMGIDKPDVRVVIHLDLPENIESYYQEAGRAGRDGLRSFATIIYQDADVFSLTTKVEQAHPPVEYLKTVYQALANYYQLAVGSGEGESFNFDLHVFSDRYQLHVPEVYNALKKLEEEGVIQFNESYYSPSMLHLAMDSVRLYQFQVANALYDPLIKMLLRLYGGELYADLTKISEAYLARALKTTFKTVAEQLKRLHELQIVVYQPAKDKPQITFVLPRQDAALLPLNIKRLAERKELVVSKMKSMISYAESVHRCRMQLIQEYFNEAANKECGICDVCIGRRRKENKKELDVLRDEVMLLLASQRLSVEELETKIAPADAEMFVEVVRELVDEGLIEYDAVWRLYKKDE